MTITNLNKQRVSKPVQVALIQSQNRSGVLQAFY